MATEVLEGMVGVLEPLVVGLIPAEPGFLLLVEVEVGLAQLILAKPDLHLTPLVLLTIRLLLVGLILGWYQIKRDPAFQISM